jgi:integrase
VRAEIEDLRPYDLRHTFATRLVERGVHHFVISALLGHAMPLTGFGFASRITPGYAHATWDAMVAAVESLEHPSPLKLNMFAVVPVNNPAKSDEARKVG